MIAYRCLRAGGEKDTSPSYLVKVVNAGIETYQNASLASLYRDNNSFNEPIVIGNNVINLSGMFANSAYNQDLVIPEKVYSLNELLWNTSQYARNIYIKGNRTTRGYLYAYNMLNNHANNKRVSIYVNNSLDFIKGQIDWTMAWTNRTDGNGYYNSSYNIYLYNNYGG